MPDFHPNEREIFIEALDLGNTDARAAFLSEVCGADVELRARVEKLIANDSEAGSFMGGTAVEETQQLLDTGDRLAYFGDYEIIEEIARGAMGVVFRARQLQLRREVALKLIRSALLATEEEKRRFQLEAEAAAGLDHPNIVPIFEVGEHEGQPYFTMKLISGGSLQDRLAEFSNAPERAAELLAKVARAIDAAHRRGILHRDIKPGNILIDDQGEPQVTDFGLAKELGKESDLTVTGQVMGTPYYMAPEQAAGRTHELTIATDVYGIGAIFFTS